VPGDPVEDLAAKIQAAAVFFEPLHHTQALLVVPETLVMYLVQRPLSGMPKGRMPQIVAESYGLGQILV
jgi:hypothetical protein